VPRLNDFRLSYCTNVHPSEKLDQMQSSLEEFTLPLKKRLFPDQEMGLGIWMAAEAASTLHDDPAQLDHFREFLSSNGFFLFTINAFPYGNIHSNRVKEKVYLPDWTEQERIDHTCHVADVLASLLPEGETGSISSLSGAFRPAKHGEEVFESIAVSMAKVVAHLKRLEDETGQLIQLGIEPEPWTTLELTSDCIHLFNEHIYRGGRQKLSQELGISADDSESLLRRYLGLCYDCCHQAVEFEDLGESLSALQAEGIPIAKMHLSCALSIPDPANNPDGIRDLLSFDEERYLHQVVAMDQGRRVTLRDLDELTPEVLEVWKAYPEWRCHFHVPIFLEKLPNMGTTRPQLEAAIDHLKINGSTHHLEIETYTWLVIPEGVREELCGGTLSGSLEQEFRWVMERLTN
jgi:hypothetical protein